MDGENPDQVPEQVDVPAQENQDADIAADDMAGS
jgi:hypothetical protein